MFKIRKRNNALADFDLTKIKEAIKKAFVAADMLFNDDILDILSLRVTADFQSKIHDNVIEIEDVQDSVENTLEKSGYTTVAKAYILY